MQAEFLHLMSERTLRSPSDSSYLFMLYHIFHISGQLRLDIKNTGILHAVVELQVVLLLNY